MSDFYLADVQRIEKDSIQEVLKTQKHHLDGRTGFFVVVFYSFRHNTNTSPLMFTNPKLS